MKVKDKEVHKRRSTIKKISFNIDDIRAENERADKKPSEERTAAENESFDPTFYDTCKTKRHEDYLDAVSHSIPIGDLFTTVAIKNDNEENQFCTVLL